MNQDPYQETLDDPNLPFSVRWPLIEEINSTNHRFGIYKTFLKDWNGWALNALAGQKKFSVLEVGSGSGGLSLEIQKWAMKNNLQADINLYDSQADVLEESLKKFDINKPKVHIATDKHLKVYPDNAFDFIISLHVIHHIQPIDVAASAIEEMLRVSKFGIFIIDLENKFLSVPFARFWNKITGVSSELSEDGIKSILRSYNPTSLISSLRPNTIQEYEITTKRFFFVPYWRISSSKK